MKILVMGYSGSGKSTLAKVLGDFYNYPILYLDNVQFYGNWEVESNDEQNKIARDFMNENDNWIIDGNYFKIAIERFSNCDKVIFLDYNRFFCFIEAYKRYRKHKVINRESCPCPDKFDSEFIWWLLYKGRTKSRRKLMFENFNKCSGEKLIFKSRKKLNKYLKSLGIINK